MYNGNIVMAYLQRLRDRLEDLGFDITDDIPCRNRTFNFVAKRTRFQLEYFGFAEIYFIPAVFTTIGRSSLKEFSALCFDYAKRSRSVPLPRGFFEMVVCFPVAVITGGSTEAYEFLRREPPPKHWQMGGGEFPVICDPKAKHLYYSETTPDWGWLYHDHFRDLIRTTLPP